MASSRRYLKDLLSQEQEPFALQSFIEERRYQLRQPKRRLPPSPTSSPLFLNVKKKSPLFDLTHAKNNPSAAACLLLEAAVRIHGGRQKQQQMGNNTKQLGLRFFSFLLKKLSLKKPARCDVNINFCTTDYSEKVVLAMDMLELEEDGKQEGPSEDVVMERYIEGETMVATTLSSCTTETSVSMEESKSSRKPEMGSPERESPAAGGSQSTKKKVLVGEDEGGGGGDELQQEKQQLSPISVLSFHEEEEEEEEEEVDRVGDQPHHQSHHEYQGDGGDQEEESFQHSLAIVQRSKDQLMRQIRRFERLAGLDPIQLDILLSQDQHEDDNESSGAERRNLHRGDIYDFARVVLESSDDSRCMGKLPMAMDLKKLLSDLFETERKETSELDGLVERVRRRLEAWNEVSCRDVDVLVDLHFRQEGEKWKSFAEHFQYFAAQIELSIFEFLVCELFD